MGTGQAGKAAIVTSASRGKGACTDVGAVIAFLAGAEASDLPGAFLAVDGGWVRAV
jgi:hypothetical protein